MKISTKHWTGAISALMIVLCSGCGEGPRPSDASPIVSPDSEPGKKAIAETESLLQLRQQQEASSRKHQPKVPDEG